MKSTKLYVGISVFWLALSMIFDGLNTLVLPDHLLDFTAKSHQATTLGLITFVGLVFGMLVQPVAGMWSDHLHHRWGRRGTIGIGVLLTLSALLLLWLSPSLLLVFLSYVFIQGALSIAQAAQQGFIPDLIPYENRGFASGLKGFMDVGGALLAFIVLGMLLGDGRFGWALMVMSLVLVTTYVIVVLFVHENKSPAPHDHPTLLDAFKFDFKQHSIFTRLVIARFLFLFGVYAVGRFLLYFVADRLHLDRNAAAEEAGSLLGALSLVAVVAAPLMGWLSDYLGRIKLMIGGSIIGAAGILLMIAAYSSGAILLAGSLMAVGSAAFSSANWAMTADVVPTAEAAQFFALANFGTAGAAATAGLLGPVVDSIGYNFLFISAATALLGSIVTLYQLAKTDLYQTHLSIR